MEFATHWQAVFQPERGDCYFDRASEIPFSPDMDGFSPANGWWLAELSRWVYNVDGTRASPRSRARQFLDRAGLRERAFLSRGGTHASLVEAQTPLHRTPFAVLAFRGSSEPRNWLSNLLAVRTRRRTHLGYERALDQIWPEIELALAHTTVPIFLTGHSMGGALASLAAMRMASAGLYTFGAPGAIAGEAPGERVPPRAWRVVNYRDLAPGRAYGNGFDHIGELIYVSHGCALWDAPAGARVTRDQRLGPRRLTGHMRAPIPEPVSDHAPVNYVAHMERFALAGDGVDSAHHGNNPEGHQ